MQTATFGLTFTVTSVLVPSLVNPPAAVMGQAYSFQLTASGGVPPYSWTLAGLPAGLSCSSSGLIAGTPTVSGTFSLSGSVSDSGS